MLTRFWQTVQLLTLVRSPAPVQQTVLPARSLAIMTAWGLPHLIAIAAFTAACQCGSSSRWRTLLLVALPVAVVARMAGVCSALCHGILHVHHLRLWRHACSYLTKMHLCVGLQVGLPFHTFTLRRCICCMLGVTPHSHMKRLYRCTRRHSAACLLRTGYDGIWRLARWPGRRTGRLHLRSRVPPLCRCLVSSPVFEVL